MIKKEKNDLNETQYWGGDCHSWSLLYYDFLEKLNPYFLIFEPYSAHSILVINFNNEIYIADSNQEKKFNIKKIKIWDKLDIWNHYIAEIQSLNPLQFNIIQWNYNEEYEYKWKKIDNKEDFISYLDNKEKNYFLLEYNYIKENWEKILNSLYIGKSKENLFIELEWIFWKTKLSLKKNKINWETNKEIINSIIKKSWKKFNKEKEKIFYSMVNKIPQWFLKQLLNNKPRKKRR
jgi:hypothetical protein